MSKKDKIKETLNELKENSDINPDLEEFFNVVNEKKHELEQVEDNKIDNTEEPIQKKSSKTSIIKTIICIIALILGIVYFIIYIKNAFNHVNYIQEIINACSLLVILIFLTLAMIVGNKRLRNVFGILTALSIIFVITINILVSKDIIELKTLPLVKDFKNVSLVETMAWANEFDIEIETIYEYSDNIEEGYIITQDILPNTILNGIKKIILTISNGPNYDKELILSNMVGLKLDDLITFINDNHLQNVSIVYEANEELEKDTIISQSEKGQIKRNTSITFKVSLGQQNALTPIKLESLVNKSEFDATLYLMKNGIKYNISYDFSDTVKKGLVISNDKIDTLVTPLTDTINLVVSKGKKITVPDFSSKTVNDVITWITENNLKVSFKESYDLNIEKGNLIDIDYKSGDVIAEGTKVTINISNGALTIPTFNSLAEFYTWADNNGIGYTQAYEFNDTVSRGNIIKLSKTTGQKIDSTKETLVVTISYGGAVTIPNFAGMSKSAIQQRCSQIGLSCGFSYAGYSSTVSKDVAISQNKTAGAKVISGTSITINLSKGTAQTFSVYISSEWFGKDATTTISNLTSKLYASCPDVTFSIITKPHNTIRSGLIHPDSPVKGGDNSFTQGQTYVIWIVQ